MGRFSSRKGTFAKADDGEWLLDRDRDAPSPRTMAEIGDDFLRDLIRKLHAPPLVKQSGAFFMFYRDGVMVYDVHVSDALDVLRLICHLLEKSWFTPRHLEQFTQLAADKFEARLR